MMAARRNVRLAKMQDENSHWDPYSQIKGVEMGDAATFRSKHDPPAIRRHHRVVIKAGTAGEPLGNRFRMQDIQPLMSPRDRSQAAPQAFDHRLDLLRR